MYSCILCFNIQTVSMIAVTLIYNRSGWLGVKHQVTYLLLVCRCTLFNSILLLLLYIISSFIIFSLIGGGGVGRGVLLSPYSGCLWGSTGAVPGCQLSVCKGLWAKNFDHCEFGAVARTLQWGKHQRRGGGGGVSRPVLTGLVTRNLLPAIKAVSVHGNS